MINYVATATCSRFSGINRNSQPELFYKIHKTHKKTSVLESLF